MAVLITQTIIVAVWITLNTVALLHHWDVYPFVLLNLVFSTQAAYAAPVLQLSQNRAMQNDRQRARADLETNQKALAEIRAVAEAVAELRAAMNPEAK